MTAKRLVLAFLISFLTAGVSSAGELKKAEFEPLKAGSIEPIGWLKHQLDLQAEGLPGRLYEYTLNFSTNSYDIAASWENGPYWLRTFVKLAVATRNERLLERARKYFEYALEHSEKGGIYDVKNAKGEARGAENIWPLILMNEAVLTWYEYTGDRRFLEMLLRRFRQLDSLNLSDFLAYDNKAAPSAGDPQEWERQLEQPTKTGTAGHYYWARIRGGDLFNVLFRLYGMTKDPMCLSLADKVFAKTMIPSRFWKHETGYAAMWCNIHTVNFAERFPYGTLYSRRSGNEAHRQMGDYWYDLHMQMWGQMPRGAYAAGEQFKPGQTDPNQAFESCSISELTRSFCLMGETTGERKWGDRAEDIVFNYTSAISTPDMRELHYINSPNIIALSASEPYNFYNNRGHVAYSRYAYRCCQCNGMLSLPLFAENLVQRGKDGELVVFLYAPNRGKADFGGEVEWELATKYPFREQAVLKVKAAKKIAVKLRIPGWAKANLKSP